MGYDCTFHLIDEKEIREVFIPKLLGRSDVTTAFDEKIPEAAEMWKTARRILAESPAAEAASEICNLAVIFAACSHPYHYERGFALTLWSVSREDAESPVPEFPDELTGTPEGLFAELVERYPGLRDQFPLVFEHNYMTGVYIPSALVPDAARWIERTAEALTPLDRRMLKGLLRILKEASGRGLAFWEATDLSLPSSVPLPADAPASSIPQIELLNRVHDVRAYDEDVLVVSSHLARAQTTFVDTSSWPPTVTNRVTDRAIHAARDASSGVWVLRTTTDVKPIQIQYMVLGKVSDSEPLQGPLEFEKGLDAGMFRDVGIVDGKIVLLPSRPGYPTDDSRPAIRGKDGKFHRATGLPAARLSSDRGSPGFLHAMGFVKLRDGGDVLIWDGNGYSLTGSQPEMVFHLDTQQSNVDWTYAPLGEHGFYYLDNRKLFAVPGPGEKTEEVLPKLTNIMQLGAGPSDWLILHEGDNSRNDAAKIYLPTEGELIHIGNEWLGDEANPGCVVFSAPAKRFILVGRKLLGLPLGDVEALPRTNARTGRKVPRG